MRNMKTISNAGLKVKAAVKAGGIGMQHNRPGLKVRAAVKAGGIGMQHNRPSLKVKAGIKAGYNFVPNHTGRPLE